MYMCIANTVSSRSRAVSRVAPGLVSYVSRRPRSVSAAVSRGGRPAHTRREPRYAVSTTERLARCADWTDVTIIYTRDNRDIYIIQDVFY